MPTRGAFTREQLREQEIRSIAHRLSLLAEAVGTSVTPELHLTAFVDTLTEKAAELARLTGAAA